MSESLDNSAIFFVLYRNLDQLGNQPLQCLGQMIQKLLDRLEESDVALLKSIVSLIHAEFALPAKHFLENILL
jgi:hypothetical protein